MGPNDKEDVSSKKPTSILAKIGNAVSGVGGFLGRGGEALGYGIIYPIQSKNWFKSFGEMWHDIKNGWNYVIGNPTKEYDPPIETTKASENLGVKIISYKDGKIKFLASRTLTGDIPYLTPEQLDKIEELNKENKYLSIAIFKEENKVVIEVDVEKITNKIKDAPENKGKSPEKIKELIIEQIKQKVDGDLKKLAKITGGELERHTDRKLLYGIAEKLYREYDGQGKSAEATKSSNTMNSSETVKKEEFNMTNPLSMYCRPEVIAAGKALESSSREQQIKEQAKGLEGAFNLENVSSETAVSSSPTPSTENNKRDGGRSLS